MNKEIKDEANGILGFMTVASIVVIVMGLLFSLANNVAGAIFCSTLLIVLFFGSARITISSDTKSKKLDGFLKVKKID